MNNDIEQILIQIEQTEPIKIVISNPKNKAVSEYKKIVISPKNIKNRKCYQFEKYTETQVFHENIAPNMLKNALRDTFVGKYKQMNVFGDGISMEIKANKENLYYISTRQETVRIKKSDFNNRKKNYILDEGMDIPVFKELGIFTSDMKVVSSMYDKFKQINRFTEFVSDALKSYGKDTINIIDFGCGKSYLTFVIYYYLVNIRHIKANIVGLDLKADVIHKCNELAKKFGYDGLRFEVGDINGYDAPFDVDMVLTLHACDTATDYALYNAIKWDADIILSVPCCQHEINKQIESEKLSALTKYGIIKERTSALITDSIRGCMLEYCGYKTELLEFIDIEHSPKNILIRALKRNISFEKRKHSYDEAISIAEEFKINQKLMEMIRENESEK